MSWDIDALAGESDPLDEYAADYIAEAFYQSGDTHMGLAIQMEAEPAPLPAAPELPVQQMYDYSRKGQPQRVVTSRRDKDGYYGDVVIEADQQPCIFCDDAGQHTPGDLYVGRYHNMHHQRWIVFHGYLCEQCSEGDMIEVRLKKRGRK